MGGSFSGSGYMPFIYRYNISPKEQRSAGAGDQHGAVPSVMMSRFFRPVLRHKDNKKGLQSINCSPNLDVLVKSHAASNRA
jgi:hypothetical protein